MTYISVNIAVTGHSNQSFFSLFVCLHKNSHSGFSHCLLIDSNSPQLFSTFYSILADLSSTLFRTVIHRFLIPPVSSLGSSKLVSGVLIVIFINIMFHNLFRYFFTQKETLKNSRNYLLKQFLIIYHNFLIPYTLEHVIHKKIDWSNNYIYSNMNEKI